MVHRRSVCWTISLLSLACLLVGLTVGCARAAESQQPDQPAQERPSPQADGAGQPPAAEPPARPFAQRVRAPEFPEGMEWLNASGPLRLQDLRGKFVLLDFWTYCCINCLHVLPVLHRLEQEYADQLVVIGVHSAKFDSEQETRNIAEAILRHRVEHPVVNDAGQRIWNMYGVRSWPTILLIDPEGYGVWGRPGEFDFEDVASVLDGALPYYRYHGLLDERPLHFDLLAHHREATPLQFPSKLLVDPSGDRLFIADSNHDRIVVAALDGRLLEVIGAGTPGWRDGSYSDAQFRHPQGLALDGRHLYVADTENHLIRRIDLEAKQVETVAGTGEQTRRPWPGLEGDRITVADLPERWVGEPRSTALASPWALLVDEDDLYVAMAGPHQIWKMRRDGSEIGPYAGNGREDIVDGPLLPRTPYAIGYSSFAQPSGLASDGQWIYVADSEGSSIRAVPLDASGEVRTVIGTVQLPMARLFAFGDQDGTGLVEFEMNELGHPVRDAQGRFRMQGVLLQHPKGVAYHDGTLFVADTYNNKIKQVDVRSTATRTLVGTGDPQVLHEPGGVEYAMGKLYIADTNNHRVRVYDLKTDELSTLEIAGLEPPRPAAPALPSFDGAEQRRLATSRLGGRAGDRISLNVALELPDGWKINPLGPMHYVVQADAPDVVRVPQAERPSEPVMQMVEERSAEFEIPLEVVSAGQAEVRVSLNYYYCQEGAEAVCRIGSVVWTVPLEIAAGSASDPVVLSHAVDP